MSYLDKQSEFEQQAADLVAQMTIEEAASQLRYNAPAIPRLGIPAYNWWNEALHGVARAGTATMFPQPIGLAAMFDEDEIERMGQIIAHEGRAKFNAAARLDDRDIYRGLTFWGPNVNIFRDPRWGRGHETYGEDPYLTGRLGAAYVRGVQGNGDYMKAAACAKHFAVHSGPESLRHEFDVEISPYDLWDTYLPGFEACVREGQVESVMGAYNRVNGEPCCASKLLIQDILRGKWAFRGHYVSDCGAIQDFHTKHKVTDTITESAALALKSGCDLNCGSVYMHALAALEEGLLTEEDIRTSAKRLFTTRFKLGLFDNNCEYNEIPYLDNDTPEHNLASLEMSRKSLVLLKNDGILPLQADKLCRVGVIGPNADSRQALMGNYYGNPSRFITNLEGITQYLEGKARVLYSDGCELASPATADYWHSGERTSEAITIAENSDVVILCLGLDSTLEGEEGDAYNAFASGDKLGLGLPECQIRLMEAVCKVGKPVIAVINSGSALDLRYADEHCAAVIQAWYSGAQGGRALAEMIFGDFSPSGKLPLTFYQSDDQLPDFCDYSMQNRTYRYFTEKPLYPFGYGLSYSRFAYRDLTPSTTVLHPGDSLDLTVTVENIGNRSADEIVEIYLEALDAPTPKPLRSLCGFRRIRLEPGKTKALTLSVAGNRFQSVLSDGSRKICPGRFRLFVGGSQPDERSRELTGNAVLSVEVEVR